jgi:hypothetical protein
LGDGGRRPGEGRDFAEIVAGAWDFERINRRYARHLKILGERPGGALRNDAAAKALLRWTAAAREAWLKALTNDPLLPGRILPSDYLGQQAWWPPAKASGGWKCSGTPADNCARSNPHSLVQTFVAYATKVRHRRGRKWMGRNRVAVGEVWRTMDRPSSHSGSRGSRGSTWPSMTKSALGKTVFKTRRTR